MMVNDRLQPKRTSPAAGVLFLLAGALGLGGGPAWAAQAPSATVPPVARPAASAPAERIGKPAPARVPGRGAQAAPRWARKEPGLPKPRSAVRRGSRTAAVKAAGSEEPPRSPKGKVAEAASGRRDPFKAWEPPGAGGAAGTGPIPGALPPGIRGLVISQLRVAGVVRQESANKMIAVVTNYTKRAYFLKENDAVYNGVVNRITPDAVYFKENTLDSNGRVNTHEVVVKVGSSAGEGR